MTRNLPRTPAQVEPYVEAIGLDDTITFILHFGGAQIYIGARPGNGSQVTKLLGIEKARALGAVHDRLPSRVPLVKSWTAQVMFAKGLPIQEIARKMHSSDTAVRRWLDGAGIERKDPKDPRQLPLL